MNKNYQHYNSLANIFRYPDEKYKSNMKDCGLLLKEHYSSAYETLLPFLEWVEKTDLYEVEEVFGKTFHIQAICYLDMGYVLFAEDYKRGDFLVKMKKEQAKANNDCGEELADNLPNVLSLIPLMEDKEFVKEFAIRIMKPTLQKMLEEFDASRIALKDKVRMKKQMVIIMQDLENKNIYEYAIKALELVVNADFPEIKEDDPEIVPTIGGNFLKSCSSGCATTVQTSKK